MCHRALTYIVESSQYIYFLYQMEKKIKNKKIATITLEGSVFHTLDPFGDTDILQTGLEEILHTGAGVT